MKNKTRRQFFVLWIITTAVAFFCIGNYSSSGDGFLSCLFLFPAKILDALSAQQVLYGFSAPFFLINSGVVALSFLGLFRALQFFLRKNDRRKFTTT